MAEFWFYAALCLAGAELGYVVVYKSWKQALVLIIISFIVTFLAGIIRKHHGLINILRAMASDLSAPFLFYPHGIISVIRGDIK